MVTKSKTPVSTPALCVVPETSPDKFFWVHGGPVVASIPELKDAIMNMSEEQFTHHTREHGNDFSRWLSEVLGQHECATSVTRAKTKTGVIRALNKYVC
jgi:hypothetical protein